MDEALFSRRVKRRGSRGAGGVSLSAELIDFPARSMIRRLHSSSTATLLAGGASGFSSEYPVEVSATPLYRMMHG